MADKKEASLPIVFIGLFIVFFVLAGFIVAFQTTLGEALITSLVLSVIFTVLIWKYPKQTVENKERNVLLIVGFFAYAILQTLHGGVPLGPSWAHDLVDISINYLIPGIIWGVASSFCAKKLAGV